MSFEFQTDSSGILSIEEAVFQALGAVGLDYTTVGGTPR